MSAAKPTLAGWILRILGLALAYFGVGWLSYTITSTGFVQAIWPPAGIALAGVLLFGWRAAPGIALGHILVTLTLFPADIPEPLPGGLPEPLLQFLLAGGLSLGPISQALIGAFLLRRFTQFPKPFENARDVVGFLLLAGPLGCLISSTWCVSLLSVVGFVEPNAFASTWFTWWAGDAIGALVVTPLVRPFLPETKAHRLRSILLPSSASAVVFVLLFAGVRVTEGKRMEAEFERRAAYMAANLEKSCEHSVWAVRTVNGFLAGREEVSRQDFEAFTHELFPMSPSLQALEWAPAVPDSERQAIEAAARGEGHSGFHITEPNAQSEMVVAKKRPLYFPLLYVEPYEQNKRAFGSTLR